MHTQELTRMATTEPDSPESPKQDRSLPVVENFTRRAAVKGAFATLGAGAFVAAVSPLRQAAKDNSAAEFMQTHYTELSDKEKADVIARLEAEAKEQYGADVTIADDRPIPGTKFVYAINLSVCNGNGKCVEACHKENNHDRDTNQSYIRVLEMPKGTMDMEQGNTTYSGTVPKDDKFYLPVQCQQCDEPPCVDVCPVKATWKEEDGIVVVDYNWCIGCRYCEAACPYHARRFNWKKPEVPADELNPDQSYLSNRVRQSVWSRNALTAYTVLDVASSLLAWKRAPLVLVYSATSSTRVRASAGY